MNAAITTDTLLPSQFGEQNHYPQVRSGLVVSMPGPDTNPLLFPTLCGTAYARRPRNGETAELALCPSCAKHRAEQRAHKHGTTT